MTSLKYDPLDERVAQEIIRLHKEIPRLGHDGLLGVLRQANIEVDPQELEGFMKQLEIEPERTRPRNSWAWATGWMRSPPNHTRGRGGWLWFGGGGGGEVNSVGDAASCDAGDGGDCD